MFIVFLMTPSTTRVRFDTTDMSLQQELKARVDGWFLDQGLKKTATPAM